LGLAAPGKTSASVAAKSETTRRRRLMRTREAVQLVVASGSRERSEVFMEPERLGAMRCGHQSWLRCGVGARGLGTRGQEVLTATPPGVARSVYGEIGLIIELDVVQPSSRLRCCRVCSALNINRTPDPAVSDSTAAVVRDAKVANRCRYWLVCVSGCRCTWSLHSGPL